MRSDYKVKPLQGLQRYIVNRGNPRGIPFSLTKTTRQQSAASTL
jgi:hypothetical protein